MEQDFEIGQPIGFFLERKLSAGRARVGVVAVGRLGVIVRLRAWRSLGCCPSVWLELHQVVAGRRRLRIELVVKASRSVGLDWNAPFLIARARDDERPADLADRQLSG